MKLEIVRGCDDAIRRIATNTIDYSHDRPANDQHGRLAVAFVIRKIAGRSGGAERVLIELANHLLERGHRIEILSYEPRRVAPFYPLRFGVTHINLRLPDKRRAISRRAYDHIRAWLFKRIGALPGLGRVGWLNENAGFVKALRRHFRANRPDVIVAWQPPAYAPCVAANEAIGARLVASTHNEPSQDYNNPERWHASSYDRRRRLTDVQRMDAIAVLIDEYRDWYPAAARARILTVPNPVVPVEATVLEHAVRQNVILAVGRLASVKRHDVLIKAWANIRSEFPGWSVRIFGQGPAKQKLIALVDELGVSDTVALMGHTSEIHAAYLGARLLCHPAAFEGFPLAVTEALAHGLPVIGFADCSGLNRLVVDGVNGRLVATSEDRVDALARALGELMRDASRLHTLSRAAPATVARFAPATVYAEWERVLAGAHECDWRNTLKIVNNGAQKRTRTSTPCSAST